MTLLATMACTLTPEGITAPSYAQIYANMQAIFQSIYGNDAVIDPSSQDGQLLAIVSLAINDSNNATIACYQSFSPTYAQSAALSSLVKINGIQRQIPTNSTSVGNVIGQAGTVITNGQVQDENGNLWNLPASVTIPLGGSIAVTVTAVEAGAISAPSGTINQIASPTFGWQSFASTVAATLGAPVESDAALKVRQTASTGIPASSPLGAIYGAVANLPGVSRAAVHENQTAATDANGVPSHSIAVVVQGGSVLTVAETIEQTKSPGTGTYGTISQLVLDPAGLPITIQLSPLAQVPVYVNVTIQPLAGYTAPTAASIQTAVVNFLNGLQIGETVYQAWLSAVAGLIGLPGQMTFKVTALTLGTAPAPSGTADIPMLIYQAAEAVAANVSVTVL